MNKHILFSAAAALALLFSCTPPETPSQEPETPSFDIEKLQPGLSSDPLNPSADEACTLYYKAGGSYPFAGYTGELYAHIGIVNLEWEHVQAEWAVNTEKCRWQKTGVADVWKLPLEPSVREWFGAGSDEAVTKIGVVVRNADGSKQTADLFCKVTDSGGGFVPAVVTEAALPSDVRTGINRIDNSTVTLVLYDRDKNGEHYPHCFLVGDFNDWTVSNDWQMKRDEAAGCWWFMLDGLTSGKEYRFQYHLLDSEGEALRLSDPYSEILYSSDDKWISSSTYPDLPSYPSGASGLVSAFSTSRPEYEWAVTDYEIEDRDDLVIYELHLRDFSATHDLSGAEQRLDYLQSLGVNAVELMPVQEFDGNDSWGYNPCGYFALDKAYGTREHYKAFIDGCHRRGMAVLLDVVYNHATGAHPMARLYWDAAANKTAANNPWFNVDAPHPYSVFHDWNHENPQVREYVKRSLRYLLSEYKFDGFRFDLTKGFTQKKSTESTAANYDASRVAILKDYAAAVFDASPKAVVIFEHFCDTREERELAGAGVKLWRNMNNAYCQTAMGWLKDGDDLSGMWTRSSSMPFGSLVGFMESHDEERTAYKALKWGNGITADLASRMKREELNAAFSLLVPGPKMIWQFGELGYDISIEENGRTGAKPLHWDYLEVPERKALHDVYASLLAFRRDNPRLFDSDAQFSWSVGSGVAVRTMTCTAADSRSFVVAGNFGVADINVTDVALPSGGTWYDRFGGTQLTTGSDNVLVTPLKAGEFRLLTNFK